LQGKENKTKNLKRIGIWLDLILGNWFTHGLPLQGTN
jgi:hypothetical protein